MTGRMPRERARRQRLQLPFGRSRTSVHAVNGALDREPS